MAGSEHSFTPSVQQSEFASGRRLPRVLGLVSAISLVAGSVIGSGIFFKANIVAGSLGRFDLILLVWVLCGVLSLLGALATAELGAMMPHAGGQYVYLREAFGPLCGFLWGWAEFWMMRSGSIAALAVAFSHAFVSSAGVWLQAEGWILMQDAGGVPVVRLSGGLSIDMLSLNRWIAIGAIGLLTLINYCGARRGALIQNITTFMKAGTLLGLMVLPFLSLTADTTLLATTLPVEGRIPLLSGLAAAMTAVFWAYDGWGNIGPIAEEIREPQRNVPLALSLGMLIVIALYVGVTVSYHLVMPVSQVADSRFVAASACGISFGRWGAAIASAAVMVSTFGALNANLMTGPRVIFAVARDGLFFRILSAVHPRFCTPHLAIVAMSVWSVILIVASDVLKNVTVPEWISVLPDVVSDPMSTSLARMSTKAIYDVLTDFVVFGAFLFYLLSVVAVFVLRVRRPELDRPYRTPGYPVLPAMFVIGAGGFLCGMLVTSPVESLIGLAGIAAGALVYAVTIKNAESRKPKDL